MNQVQERYQRAQHVSSHKSSTPRLQWVSSGALEELETFLALLLTHCPPSNPACLEISGKENVVKNAHGCSR